MSRDPNEISVVGRTTRVTGRVSGAGPLRIEGSVKGDINVTADTEVTETGSVEGNLQGDGLDIAGTLLGDARATGAIAIRSTARVRGELRAAEVSIEAGAHLSVKLESEFALDFDDARLRG